MGRNIRAASAGIVTALVIVCCARVETTMASPNDDLFATVPFDSGEKHECSPRFERFTMDLQGIRINAPKQVVLSFNADGKAEPETRFTVCIAMQFPSKFLQPLGDPLRPLITLVAEDAVTGKHYTSGLGYSRMFRPSGRRTLSPEELEGSVERHYFNVNLVDFIDLPAKSARYQVHAVFEQHASNVLEVQVEARPANRVMKKAGSKRGDGPTR